MIMEKNINGTSGELITHPGELLGDILTNRKITQKELALRSGISEKHISNIINGINGITPNIAQKLEYVLNVDSDFWINFQAIYDAELLSINKMESISEVEEEIASENLKPIAQYLVSHGILEKTKDRRQRVLDFRNFLGIADLSLIPKMAFNGAFKARPQSYDPFILFAWVRICEALASKKEVINTLDIDKLAYSIPRIKEIMLMPEDDVRKWECLDSVFFECGIAFCIVKHFTGAPVQGFIKDTDDGKLILCMTVRQKYADIFWFTLFHEIAHVINGDFKYALLDFANVKNESEIMADDFARNALINDASYNDFVKNNTVSEKSIISFSKSAGVPPYITVGRLQHDEIIGWHEYSHLKVRYELKV